MIISDFRSGRSLDTTKRRLTLITHKLELLVQSTLGVGLLLHVNHAVQAIVSDTDSRPDVCSPLAAAHAGSSQDTHRPVQPLRRFECKRGVAGRERLFRVFIVVRARARLIEDVALILVEFFVCASGGDHTVSACLCVPSDAGDFRTMRAMEQGG